MMAALDDAVGLVADELHKQKIEENTLIFFLSDNGSHLPAGGQNTPLRDGKGTTWEGGIRIPFFMTWPAAIPAGEFSQPISSLDILPTSLAAAGISPPANAKVDGVDLVPYLIGQKKGTPHETLYWRYGDFLGARQGKWKMTSTPTTDFELFDLSTDISEVRNVSSEHPAIADELRRKIDAWLRSLPPPAWPPGVSEPNLVGAKAR